MDVKNIEIGKPIEYGYLGIKRRLECILKNVDIRNKHLLDVGCGNGAQTIEFLKYVNSCKAVDIEYQRLEDFKKRLKELNINNCEIKQMDASQLEYPDNTFDAVVSIETLEHVPDPEKTLKEMKRVLKNNGDLILSVPNKWWIFETHGAALPLLPWNRVPFFSWLPKKIHDKYAHARIYTQKEIINLVENSGFKIVKTEYLMPPLDKVRNKKIQSAFRKLLFNLENTSFKCIGVSIFVFAKKIL